MYNCGSRHEFCMVYLCVCVCMCCCVCVCTWSPAPMSSSMRFTWTPFAISADCCSRATKRLSVRQSKPNLTEQFVHGKRRIVINSTRSWFHMPKNLYSLDVHNIQRAVTKKKNKETRFAPHFAARTSCFLDHSLLFEISKKKITINLGHCKLTRNLPFDESS